MMGMGDGDGIACELVRLMLAGGRARAGHKPSSHSDDYHYLLLFPNENNVGIERATSMSIYRVIQH
jgi:hypothetical protein